MDQWKDAGPRERAAMKAQWSLGEEDPRAIEAILTDLRDREALGWEQIAALPPERWEALNERYGWIEP